MAREFANKGGIIGSNSHGSETSETFRVLKEAIAKRVETYTPKQKIDNHLFGLKVNMEFYIRENHPFLSTGDFIQEMITAFGVKKKTFAKYIDIEDSVLSSLLNDQRKINTDLAMKLGRISKADPVLWLGIQNKNELRKVESEIGSQYDKYSLEDLFKKAV